MFLYECIRSQFTSPGVRNVVAFYGFASAVYLETMSHLPADKKRVERLKEIFEEDSAKSMALFIYIYFQRWLILGMVAFHAGQVLEVLRNGCLRGGELRRDLPPPPPILLPYFGMVRIVDKQIDTRHILEQDFSDTTTIQPPAVALHPPSPVTTVPQVQDDFYNMNMENEVLMDQPFGGSAPLNWAFNFAMDPAESQDVGQLPMDIEAWSTVNLSSDETES